MALSSRRPLWPLLLPLFLLLAPSPAAAVDLRLDGGAAGWDAGWRTQVDGVMGGRSSGTLRFEDGNSVLSFAGAISLNGGGFSSVRKNLAAAVDLTPYAGILVRLETTRAHEGEGDDVRPPLGLHLQFHDTVSRSLGFASAFAVPLANAVGEETSVFLPLSSFDRGSRMGYTCINCRIDFSTVDEMDIYVLFQEGPFDIKVKSITAVESPVSHPSPVIEVGSDDEIRALILSTTESGGGLYNQGYVDLCNAIYRSTLNTLLAAQAPVGDGAEGAVTAALRDTICQGLRRAAPQSKADAAWTLRYTLDGVLEELGFLDPDQGTGWRPAAEGSRDDQCRGVTSVVVSQGSTATLDTATMAEAESVEAADERTAIPGDGNAPADILSSSSTAAMPRTEILAAFAISVFLYVGL